MDARVPDITMAEIRKLSRAYGNPQLTLADYGYLLDVHPLEIRCAGELLRTSATSFGELNARAADTKRASSAWLFETRNRRAQDLRLNIQIERDAFDRMTAYWRRLAHNTARSSISRRNLIGS